MKLITREELKELIRRRSGLLYVAGPYSAKLPDGKEDKVLVQERMSIFSRCMEQLMLLNALPVSPMLMHMVRQECADLPGDWAYWRRYSETVLANCNILVVITIPGWEDSTGIKGEVRCAGQWFMPVVYITPEELLKETTS